MVARRLRQVGLGGACLALHGKEQTSRAVRAHLRTASERVARQDPDTTGIEELERRRGEVIERLARYPRDLRDEGPDGVVEVDIDERTAAVREYIEVSEEFRQALRAEIAESVVFRAHETSEPNEPNEPSDAAQASRDGMEALRHEVRTGHASGLQELVSGHIDAILRVTPCLLMSPSTVAQYLPARPGLFDLVVFDESSQIRVSAAVGALGRARAAVIVGDTRQMPPSELFTVAGGEPEDDGEQESILLEAHRAGVPGLRLDNHYRSRSEGLVSFSNRHYYDGGLATFPAPPGARTGSGVEIRRVPGSYEQGRGGRKLNIVEANAVIDEVRAVVDAHPEASVGVITFNTSQAEYIAEKLEADDSENLRLALAREDEPLFVKNLENVQGDERDFVLFSLTYSVGADGRLPSNFGLLSRKGGERRLNVALTRARVRNVLFCSFDPADIADSGDVSRGPEHLREYLQAAESGDLMVDGVGEADPDYYRDDVAARLREAGAEVMESVGLSAFRVDIAVRVAEMTENSWVAVQLDSAEWAGRASVADRDALPEAVLVGGMGWVAFTQVYRAAWVLDESAEVERILALCRSVAEPVREEVSSLVPSLGSSTPTSTSSSTPSSTAPVSGSEDAVVLPPEVARAVAAQAETVHRLAKAVAAGDATNEALAEALESLHATVPEDPDSSSDAASDSESDAASDSTPALTPFVPASQVQCADRTVLQQLPSAEAAKQVGAHWRDVVAAEGPVQLDRALRIVAQRFGWRHLMPHRRGAVLDCLPSDVRRDRAVWQGETFLWPAGMDPETYREVRGGSRADRKIAEIAPQERANAIRLVLAESDGRCSEGDLVRGVNEVFGFGWLGGMSRGQLRNDLTPLLESHEVRLDTGDVVLTSTEVHVR